MKNNKIMSINKTLRQTINQAEILFIVYGNWYFFDFLLFEGTFILFIKKT